MALSNFSGFPIAEVMLNTIDLSKRSEDSQNSPRAELPLQENTEIATEISDGYFAVIN
jgi:hypothetical protein